MSDTDLLERLSRINPVPYEPPAPPIAPLLERLDGAPQRHERRRRVLRRDRVRRPLRALALGAAGAGAVGVALLILLGSSGPASFNVAAAMYKATTPGSGVLHMSTLTENIVGAHTNVIHDEFWSEQNPRRIRIIISIDGGELESALTTSPMKLLQWSKEEPDVITQSVPTGIATTEQSAVQILRELVRKGEITEAGKTTFHGQPAYLLEVHPQYHVPTLNGQPLPNPTVVVDASTFVPLESTSYSVSSEHGTPELMTSRNHYLAYEELPPNEQDEALLGLAQHPGASIKTKG